MRLAVLLLLPLSLFAQTYRRTTIPTLGGKATAKHPNTVMAINNAGQVLGCSPDISLQSRMYVWSKTAGIRDLGILCGSGSISDLGHVAGWSSSMGGFTWTPDGFTDVGPMNFAAGINNVEQAVGSYYTDSTQRFTHAFLWQNSALEDLGTLGGSLSFGTAINDSGQIIGWSFTDTQNTQSAPFIWSREAGMQIVGNGFGAGYSINRSGQVAGSSLSGHAAIWTQAGMQDLGVLPGTDLSTAYSVNNNGVAVGNSWISLQQPGYVFVWSPQGMVNINLACNNPQKNWKAVGINDAGQILINRKSGPALLLTPR